MESAVSCRENRLTRFHLTTQRSAALNTKGDWEVSGEGTLKGEGRGDGKEIGRGEGNGKKGRGGGMERR